MRPKQHCRKCDERVDYKGICPACGTQAATVVNLRPATLRMQTRNPSVIIAGPDAATGDYLVKVDDHNVHSESRLTTDGQVSLKVKGVDNVGRSGERRAVKTFRQMLQAAGKTVSIKPGDDARGEDAILICDTKRYTLQLVTTPSVPAFWREASVGPAMTRVQIEQAVGWIRSTIEAKAHRIPHLQRSNTVLTIDARHAGILTSPRILDAYVGKFTDPVNEFGFASVWVIGPAAQYCGRIGEGTP